MNDQKVAPQYHKWNESSSFHRMHVYSGKILIFPSLVESTFDFICDTRVYLKWQTSGFLPIVHLQKGETCLCCDLSLLVLCWVWMLEQTDFMLLSQSLGLAPSLIHLLKRFLSHHEVLEEPGAHDIRGVFGQHPPFVLGLLVFTVQQGCQIHVHLYKIHSNRK